MRTPCQVTTTSPGTSASQADAERQRADHDQKMTTRIIARPACRAPRARRRRCAARGDRRFARLRFLGPAGDERLARDRAARRSRQRRGNVAARGIDIDPRDHRAGSLPGGASTGVMRTSRCALALSLPRNVASAGTRVRGLAAKPAPERQAHAPSASAARHAGSGKGFKRRCRFWRAAERLHRFKLGLDTARRARRRRAAPRRRPSGATA